MFPTPDRDTIMKQQIIVANSINGYDPDSTDSMEYRDFLDWYNKMTDLYEDEDDAE
jgi:hypothetical protein